MTRVFRAGIYGILAGIYTQLLSVLAIVWVVAWATRGDPQPDIFVVAMQNTLTNFSFIVSGFVAFIFVLVGWFKSDPKP